MRGSNFHYDTNVNNAWVAFKLGGACSEGKLSIDAAHKFLEVIDKFKPKSNMFVIAGDYDDRFGETLTNLYRYEYAVVLETYCKEKNISKDMAISSLDDNTKRILNAKALNEYVEQITMEENGKVISLTEIAECDIANDIYDGQIKGNNLAEKVLSSKAKTYLGIKHMAADEESFA